MKKSIIVIALASLLGTPALADKKKFNLSEYKTIAVQPVLAASNTRGQFEAELAASASGLSYAADKAPAIKKASSAMLESQGFGFAGKATGGEIALLQLAATIGMVPTVMQLDAEKAKQNASQLMPVLGKLEGKVAPDVLKGLSLVLQAAQAGDFQTSLKAALVTMTIAVDNIKKGTERVHCYIAVGLYAGIATTWAAAGKSNTAFGGLAGPLVSMLEEDAAMGGADRTIAMQVKAIANDLSGGSPSVDRVLAAMTTMESAKPD